MTCCLYRHFSDKGELLYVGISISLLMRTYAHVTTSAWRHEIAKITIERFANAEEARIAEVKAIQTECPVYNVNDKQKDIFRKPKPTFLNPSQYPHQQLDSLKLLYNIGDWSIGEYLGYNMETLNQIRREKKPLSTRDVVILRKKLGTTFKKLESIGISKEKA